MDRNRVIITFVDGNGTRWYARRERAGSNNLVFTMVPPNTNQLGFHADDNLYLVGINVTCTDTVRQVNLVDPRGQAVIFTEDLDVSVGNGTYVFSDYYDGIAFTSVNGRPINTVYAISDGQYLSYNTCDPIFFQIMVEDNIILTNRQDFIDYFCAPLGAGPPLAGDASRKSCKSTCKDKPKNTKQGGRSNCSSAVIAAAVLFIIIVAIILIWYIFFSNP